MAFYQQQAIDCFCDISVHRTEKKNEDPGEAPEQTERSPSLPSIHSISSNDSGMSLSMSPSLLPFAKP